MTEDQKKFCEAAKAACEKYGRQPLVMLESKSAGRDSGWMDFAIQRWSLIYSGAANYDLHRELDAIERKLGEFLCFAEEDCTSVEAMAAEVVSSDDAEIFYPERKGESND